MTDVTVRLLTESDADPSIISSSTAGVYQFERRRRSDPSRITRAGSWLSLITYLQVGGKKAIAGRNTWPAAAAAAGVPVTVAGGRRRRTEYVLQCVHGISRIRGRLRCPRSARGRRTVGCGPGRA